MAQSSTTTAHFDDQSGCEVIHRAYDPLVDELADQPFVVVDPDETLREIFDAACTRHGVTPTIAFEGADITTLRGLIGARLGVGILPRAPTTSPDVVEIAVADEQLVRTIAIGWMASRYLPPSAVSFRDSALASYRNQ